MSKRLYLDNLEPIDLPDEWFDRIEAAGHVTRDDAGTPFLHPTLAAMVFEARGLRSEDGENPEYDRALVELIHHVGGYDEGDYPMLRELVL